MRLFFDSVKQKEIAQLIIDKHNEGSQNRTRVHLSDTCYCPIKTLHRLIGFPATESDSGAGIMMTGTMGQMIIQNLYPEGWAEYESDFLPSHVDLMEFIDGEKHPHEIKFTTRAVNTSSEIPEGWKRQLMRYLAVHDSDYGWFDIMNLRTRAFTTWKMIMDAEERAALREEILRFKAVILEAVDMYKTYVGDEGYQEAIDHVLKHLPMDMTMNQVKDCGYCQYKKSRKRTKQGINKNCEKAITKKMLVS